MIKTKSSSYLLFIAVIVSLLYFIDRDIKIEHQYPGDLRNRIVGARLQMDGKLPYFFKWKSPADNRYLDYSNYDSNKVSNITASPFLHQLISPIANFPQRTISRLWLFFEYLAILIMAGVAFFYLAKYKKQKTATLFALMLLLSTAGWKWHIAQGQYYIFVSFSAALFYFYTLKYQKGFLLFGIGILAACLLLLRPNLIFFLLPFLFVLNKYKVIIFGSFVLFMLLYFSISGNRMVWKEYNMSLVEQTKIHQGLDYTKQYNSALIRNNLFEGWDLEKAKQAQSDAPKIKNGESANVFVLVKSLLKYKMPVWLLAVLPFVISGLLCFVFWYQCIRKQIHRPSINDIAILGFCLYMISDLCSPTYRFLYNFPQWAFPVILVASQYNLKYVKAYIIILLGLLLNIIEINSLRSEHSVGEYILLFGMLYYAFIIKKSDDSNLTIPIKTNT